MPEGGLLSDDYAHGRGDGLRLALAMLAAEEAKWSALDGRYWRWHGLASAIHAFTLLRWSFLMLGRDWGGERGGAAESLSWDARGSVRRHFSGVGVNDRLAVQLPKANRELTATNRHPRLAEFRIYQSRGNEISQ